MTRWTEAQLAEYKARVRGARRLPDTSAPPFQLPANTAGAFALGRLPAGTMNKSEAAYAAHLAYLQTIRQVLWWKFEGLKLRLADNTFYTPDFAVMAADCRMECHEVKGFWRDDARVKVKVAAAQFPFRFVAVTKRALKHGGGWDKEEFS
jgi:hypothetical protein